MGFLNAMKRRRAEKIAAKKLASQDGESGNDETPQSPASTLPPTPEPRVREYTLYIPEPFDKSLSNLDCETHATSESLQVSVCPQDSTFQPRDGKIIDAINLETALSQIRDDDDLSITSATNSKMNTTLTMTEGCTMKSISSDAGIKQVWRYLTCDFEHDSSFDILNDDDGSSICTNETRDGSLSLLTAPKRVSGANCSGRGLNKIEETDEIEDYEENSACTGNADTYDNTARGHDNDNTPRRRTHPSSPHEGK